jgi:hypothetical protein
MALKYKDGKLVEVADAEYSFDAPKPEFTFNETAPTFNDKYAGKIDTTLNEILNREDFSYDHTQDDTYKQYEKTYTREGDRAMRDTLAQVAARTGGMASTYAVGAAQQANQYYQQQLADKIPELKQLAYDMYLSNLNQKRGDLDMLRVARQDDYGMFRDGVLDYYTNRDFAYGQHRDAVGDWQTDRNFDYGIYRDDISDQNYIAESLYGQNQDSIANQRAQEQLALQQAAQALQRQSFDREATWRSEDISRENPQYADDVIAVAAALGIDERAAAALKNTGSTEWNKALKNLGISQDGGGGKPGSTKDLNYNNTYEAAVETMRDLGVDDNEISSVLPRERWELQKMAYENSGVGVAAVSSFDSYDDYLMAVVEYAEEQGKYNRGLNGK